MGQRLEEDPALKERTQAIGTARMGRHPLPPACIKYVSKFQSISFKKIKTTIHTNQSEHKAKLNGTKWRGLVIIIKVVMLVP